MTAPYHVPGAPDDELARSEAAQTVGRLAHASGLAMFHFEHRLRLASPEAWLPPGRGPLDVAPGWVGGVLPEAKYQAFRHDLLLGSFHPGHRPKWTAHELCHGLVGFAWKPDASLFFHALAARLAEVLPVALWYFLDEAGLGRCALHQGHGPLYDGTCSPCDDAARGGPARPAADDGRWLEDGQAFVERELAAVEDSLKRGAPVPHRLGRLDLASDGVAYAAAHGGRLRSPEFARFVEIFSGDGKGHHPSLDSLAARVREVLTALSGGQAARPLAGGRWDWICQDLGWRLLEVVADTAGDIRAELETLVERLADDSRESTVGRVIEAYEGLHGDFELPSPREIFAVGYPLPRGYGHALAQLGEGIASALPQTWVGLGPGQGDLLSAFAAQDPHVRAPIGRRFATFLKGRADGPTADRAAYEAAVSHASPADPLAESFGMNDRDGGCIRLADGVELLRLTHPVVEEVGGEAGEPISLAIYRHGDGEVQVVSLSPAIERALRSLEDGPCDRAELGLDPADLEGLAALRVVVPTAWTA